MIMILHNYEVMKWCPLIRQLCNYNVYIFCYIFSLSISYIHIVSYSLSCSISRIYKRMFFMKLLHLDVEHSRINIKPLRLKGYWASPFVSNGIYHPSFSLQLAITPGWDRIVNEQSIYSSLLIAIPNVER